jgi:hypothetical protein
VTSLGYTPHQARVYTIAYESFLLNLNVAGVVFNQSVLTIDLGAVKTALIYNFGQTEARAEYIVSAANLVRMVTNEYGVQPTNLACHGMAGRSMDPRAAILQRN